MYTYIHIKHIYSSTQLEDFLLRNCREQLHQVYPNSGFGKWLRKNDDIDSTDQANEPYIKRA